MAPRALDPIESLCALDAAGRGIGRLVVPGAMAAAAASLTRATRVALVTGFVPRPERLPRRAEIALQQGVPERDRDREAERVPERRHRLREDDGAVRIAHAGLGHRDPLHLEARLDDVAER